MGLFDMPPSRGKLRKFKQNGYLARYRDHLDIRRGLLSPWLLHRVFGDCTAGQAFRIKNHPRSLPRRRIQRVPLGESAVDTERDSAWPSPRVPVPCLGPGPTALGTVSGPGPGAPVGVLE